MATRRSPWAKRLVVPQGRQPVHHHHRLGDSDFLAESHPVPTVGLYGEVPHGQDVRAALMRHSTELAVEVPDFLVVLAASDLDVAGGGGADPEEGRLAV